MSGHLPQSPGEWFVLIAASVIPALYFMRWHTTLIEPGLPRSMAFAVTAGAGAVLFGVALRHGRNDSDLAIALVALVPFVHLIVLNWSVRRFAKRTGREPQNTYGVRGAPWSDRLFNVAVYFFWIASYVVVAWMSEPYVI